MNKKNHVDTGIYGLYYR